MDRSGSAFEKLYAHYSGRVRYAVARAAHRRRHSRDVDELNQEVWFRLLDHGCVLLRRHDPRRGRFGPFISTVAYQQALKAIERYERQLPGRGAKANSETLVDDESLRFVDQIIDEELFGKLLSRIDVDLTERERVLVRQLHIEQRSSRAVAQHLGISENALYKRNERLRKRLSRVLEDLLGSRGPRFLDEAGSHVQLTSVDRSATPPAE